MRSPVSVIFPAICNFVPSGQIASLNLIVGEENGSDLSGTPVGNVGTNCQFTIIIPCAVSKAPTNHHSSGSHSSVFPRRPIRPQETCICSPLRSQPLRLILAREMRGLVLPRAASFSTGPPNGPSPRLPTQNVTTASVVRHRIPVPAQVLSWALCRLRR